MYCSSEMLKQHLDGDELFFQFTHGARAGSIGRLNIESYEYYTNKAWVGLYGTITWDDRPNKLNMDNWGGHKQILINQGGTKWVYNISKNDKLPKDPEKDLLGKLPNVGDMVVTIISNPKTIGNEPAKLLTVGEVLRIGNTGAVFITPVKTIEGMHHKLVKNEYRLQPGQYMTLSENIFNDLLIAKLGIK